jgi:hypothetical protein
VFTVPEVVSDGCNRSIRHVFFLNIKYWSHVNFVRIEDSRLRSWDFSAGTAQVIPQISAKPILSAFPVSTLKIISEVYLQIFVYFVILLLLFCGILKRLHLVDKRRLARRLEQVCRTSSNPPHIQILHETKPLPEHQTPAILFAEIEKGIDNTVATHLLVLTSKIPSSLHVRHHYLFKYSL